MNGIVRCLGRGSVVGSRIGCSPLAYSGLRRGWSAAVVPPRLPLSGVLHCGGRQLETWMWSGVRANSSNAAANEVKERLREIIDQRLPVGAFESILKSTEGTAGGENRQINAKELCSMLKGAVKALHQQGRGVDAAELLLMHNSRAEGDNALVLDRTVYEGMIKGYLTGERGIEAGRVLREMTDKDVKPSGAIISAVIKSHCTTEDFLSAMSTVKHLKSKDVKVAPSDVEMALLGLLRAYFSAGKKEVDEILETEGKVSHGVMSELIVGWCGKGDTAQAAGVLETMLKAGNLPSKHAVTSLIRAYCSQAKEGEARALLERIPDRVSPSARAAIVKAYCMKNQLATARQMVVDVVESSDKLSGNILWSMMESIATHSNGGKVAEQLLREFEERGVPGTEGLHGKCVDTFLKAGHHQSAARLMAVMHAKDMTVPMGPYLRLAESYLAQASYDKLAQLMKSLKKMGRGKASILKLERLIEVHCASFSESKAWQQYRSSNNSKDSPREELCTVILASLRERNGTQRAIAAFDTMVADGVKPDRGMLKQVLRAQAHCGQVTLAEQTAAMLSALPLSDGGDMQEPGNRDGGKAQERLARELVAKHKSNLKNLNVTRPFALSEEELGDEHWQPVALEGGMEEIGGVPISFKENLSLDEYNWLLYAHTCSGNTEGAERVLTRMCDSGVLPNFTTWKLLATAHVASGSTEVAVALISLLENIRTNTNAVSTTIRHLRQQLIGAYSMLGQQDKALAVVRKLGVSGQCPSFPATDALITAYLGHGDVSGAVLALKELVSAGSRPPAMIYGRILKEWRAWRLGWRSGKPKDADADPEIVLDVCQLASMSIRREVLCKGIQCLGITGSFDHLSRLIETTFYRGGRVSADVCEAVFEALNDAPLEHLVAFWEEVSTKHSRNIEMTHGVFTCATVAFLRHDDVAGAVKVLQYASNCCAMSSQALYTISRTVVLRSRTLACQKEELQQLRDVIATMSEPHTPTTDWPLQFDQWPKTRSD